MIDEIIALFSLTSTVSRMNNSSLSCLSSRSCNANLWIARDNNSFCFSDNLSNDYGYFGVQHTVNDSGIISSGSTSVTPRQNFEEPCQGEAHLSFMPVQEDIFYQPWTSIYLQQSDNELQQVRNARKRTLDASDAIQQTSSGSFDLIKSASNEGTETEEKKRQVDFQEKHLKIQKEKVPTVRKRSHKLTDKITALQKLVSPYGKTDTASVLLEASISIKALHDQIKDLCNMISEEQRTDMTGETRSNLQYTGLCLVSHAILEELDY